MLHAGPLPSYGWPGMSQTGPDLLLHSHGVPHAARAGGGGGGDGVMGPHHPLDTGHHSMGGAVMFNNVNSFYSPHQPFSNIFSPAASYTVHHPAARPPTREPEALRHPSGGSVGSHTPPSPEDRGTNHRHGGVIMDRSSGVRNSQGSDQTSQSPGTAYRLPPSPNTQKSPFDLTTSLGLSKSQSIISHTVTSAFSSAAVRAGSVISSGRLAMPGVNIKQEPGSPANQGSPATRHSPRTGGGGTVTPPPANMSQPYSRQGRIQNSNNTTTPGPGPGGFNFPSPGQPHPISPAEAGTNNSQSSNSNNNNSTAVGNSNSRPASKFRYPSGPSQASQGVSGQGVSGQGVSVQNMSPGDTQSNSAMSSREGTPGPARQSWCADTADHGGPAPNVDISNVQVKEEFGPGSVMRQYEGGQGLDDYSRRPSVNLSYPAVISSSGASSHIDTYSNLSSPSSYGTYHHTHHAMPQQVPSLPPRGFHPMRPGTVHPGLHPGGVPAIPGRPALSLASNTESSSHSNVKIGRRPAHLPKVLKFSDNTLPHGWVRKLKQRKHGKQAGRWDVYIYSPCGVKFASRKKLRHFFEKNSLQYDPEDFDFTPYGRHIEQSGHGRHGHSSSEGSHRHGGSPSSVASLASPTSSYSNPANLHTEYKSDFIGPANHVPPTAHRPHTYIHPHHQPPMFPSDYNPMMESPPNANALEVPQHQILNLSQTQILPSPGSRVAGPSLVAPAHPATTSNFPPDIATILNEPSDNQFRQSLREYQNDLTTTRVGPGAGGGGGGGSGADQHPMQVDEGGGAPGAPGSGSGEKKESLGEDTRFMTRTYNLLTASQGDLGDMMDEYSIYPE